MLWPDWALLPVRSQVFVNESHVAAHFFLPAGVGIRIELRPWALRLIVSKQPGHRFGIARHENLPFRLEQRFRLRPALPQITNGDRFHKQMCNMFHSSVNPCSGNGGNSQFANRWGDGTVRVRTVESAWCGQPALVASGCSGSCFALYHGMNFLRETGYLLTCSLVWSLTAACNPQSQNDPQPSDRQDVATAPAPVEPAPPSSITPAASPEVEKAGIEPAIKSVRSDAPGEFEITYEWTLTRKLDDDWRIYVHFTDAAGAIVFQNDHDATPPTSQWKPGKVVQGPKRVKIPDGFSGTVEIRMGLYARDKVGEGSKGRATLDGHCDTEKRIVVGHLEIQDGKVVFIHVNHTAR